MAFEKAAGPIYDPKTEGLLESDVAELRVQP